MTSFPAVNSSGSDAAGRSRHRGLPAAALLLLVWVLAAVDGAQARTGDAGEPPAIALSDCRISDALGLRSRAARCGTLTRPENPSDPEGRQIELFVAVVPALTPNPAAEAFTAIAGGPGAASTEFYAGLAEAFEGVRRERDIVLVDQRGTGRSNALNCPQAGGQGLMESPAQVLELTAECLEQLPGDPRFYTTSVAVGDLDAVRAALGYARLDVYGVSYGTRVAQHYLRRYPQHTRTVVLDGVVPPQIPLGPRIALDAQAALERIFARCAASAPCAERFPSLGDTFQELRTRLAAQPVSLTLADPYSGAPREVTIGENELRMVVRMLSYEDLSVSLLPLMITRAHAGHYGPLAAQALMVMDSLGSLLSYGMHNAVMCTEDAPFFDGYLREEERAALPGTYLGEQQLTVLAQMCEQWPAGVLDENFKAPVRSDHPVLVLSGEHDPITPPGNAELAIGPDGEYLRNALHVVVPGQGHGVAGAGCVPQLIGRFVDEGATQELQTACVERLGPAAFFIDSAGTAP